MRWSAGRSHACPVTSVRKLRHRGESDAFEKEPPTFCRAVFDRSPWRKVAVIVLLLPRTRSLYYGDQFLLSFFSQRLNTSLQSLRFSRGRSCSFWLTVRYAARSTRFLSVHWFVWVHRTVFTMIFWCLANQDEEICCSEGWFVASFEKIFRWYVSLVCCFNGCIVFLLFLFYVTFSRFSWLVWSFFACRIGVTGVDWRISFSHSMKALLYCLVQWSWDLGHVYCAIENFGNIGQLEFRRAFMKSEF